MKRSTLAVPLFLLLLAFAVPTPVWSQGMMVSPEERASRLKERLALTDEQTETVKKIFEKSQEEMMETMMLFEGDREARRKAMTEMVEKTDKEIEAVLTKEQKKKYEEFKKERQQMRPRMQDRRRQN